MTEHILSCSYGKDSLACIGACKELGWPIDRIVHAEVWATDTIPADLPPMVEFKKKADKIIKERYGIEVEHVYATRSFQRPLNVGGGYKCTYENTFYQEIGDKNGKWAINRERAGNGKCHNPNGKRWIYGFPIVTGPWCNSKLKVEVLESIKKGNIRKPILQGNQERDEAQGQNMGMAVSERSVVHGRTEETTAKFLSKGESEVVQYLGIASDEPIRIERHKDKPGIKLPLVEIGWTEADAKQWCIDNDLLSPIYTDKCMRGGCWFCHNQGVDQLRQLRKNYPDLWELLLKWDNDSPVTFHADGHTVHDFDRRFQAEDEGFIYSEDRFKWASLDMQQFNIFHFFDEDGNYKGGAE